MREIAEMATGSKEITVKLSKMMCISMSWKILVETIEVRRKTPLNYTRI